MTDTRPYSESEASVLSVVRTGPFRAPIVSGLNSWVTAPECPTMTATVGL